jgi:pyruvate,water dikinase
VHVPGSALADVVLLEAARRGDAALVGGKAANLGELIANGFPVPAGFVVTAAAYRRFAGAAGLGPLVAALQAAPAGDTDAPRAALVERIRSAAVPGDLAEAIAAAHRALLARNGASDLCVVRSSGTAEDLAAASFAGQHGTYYYVDQARLLEMIRSCWASLWSDAVVTYRAAHGMDHAAAQMAVLVQRQIPAEISGVTFTANPVTGARSEIVIEASWGMGAAIVDGRVTPDRYIFARDGLVLKERKLSRKRFRVSTTTRAGPEGRLLDVPLEQQHAGTLAEDVARSVAAVAVRAEEHFGAPQDVEWAIARGELHVLQSRPITAAGRKPFCRNPRGGKYVLFKPVAENFTDPLTPLSLSLWLGGLAGAPLVVIGGRLYFDLTKLRRLFPFKLTDQEIAQLLYLSADGVRPRLRLALTRLPFAALVAGLILLAYANVYARTAHLPADFLDGFRRLAGSVDRDARYGVREAMRELFLGTSLWRRLVAPMAHQILLVNTSAARYMVWFGALKRLLARWLPDAPPEALGLLASGGPGMRSAETGRRLRGLALQAGQSDATRRLLVEQPPERALAMLRRTPEATAFVRELDAFLATFGHRALKEFEFRAARWEEDPVPVLGMIRNYLLADRGSDDHDRRAAEKRAQLDGAIDRVPGIGKHILRWVARRTRYLATLRENSRFYWVLGAYVVRKKILRLEETLIARGLLRCKDDIFFLEWDEVQQLRAGRLGWSDVEPWIGHRRREYVRLSKVTPPRVVGIEQPAPALSPVAAAETGTILRGQSASAGRHEGRARVILDPEHNVELRQGEILVAPYTDPAWTPLFLTAGAAVVEVGSFLSHAGTVAREYGLPCVVDVAECTAHIRTGDRLVVDGDAGVVHIVATAEAG